MGARYVAILGFLSALFTGSAVGQGAKAGGLYSVEDGGGRYAIAKVLLVERDGVHVRLYKNKFPTRPAQVDFSSLSLGTVHDKDGFGMGHIPITHNQFRHWRPVFVGESAVVEEELDGYRMWKDAKGGFFGSK
jgi:hypothetical protein